MAAARFQKHRCLPQPATCTCTPQVSHARADMHYCATTQAIPHDRLAGAHIVTQSLTPHALKCTLHLRRPQPRSSPRTHQTASTPLGSALRAATPPACDAVANSDKQCCRLATAWWLRARCWLPVWGLRLQSISCYCTCDRGAAERKDQRIPERAPRIAGLVQTPAPCCAGVQHPQHVTISPIKREP